MSADPLAIRCLEITQPIGSFYVAVMDARTLLRIAYADIRRLESREVETYLGIQRPLSPSRVQELTAYVNTLDATFPTAVILALSSENAEYNRETGIMQIVNAENVAKIIDGQHRIAGLEGLKGETFQVNVVIFIDMDIEDQAMVFATINLAQTKVSKSLVYDLFEFTTSRSPQKTAHDIARLLNSRPGSPLYKRIKILGTADLDHRQTQILTQATFVEALVALISGSVARAQEDREALKRHKRLRDPSPDELWRLPFRRFFIEEKDAVIARILWNYFCAVAQRWPTAWEQTQQRGNMLPRTNGFRALMRFFPEVYAQATPSADIVSTGQFLSFLRMVDLDDEDFDSTRYPPGTGGESRLLRELQEQAARLGRRHAT